MAAGSCDNLNPLKAWVRSAFAPLKPRRLGDVQQLSQSNDIRP